MRSLWPVDVVALNPVSCGAVLWRIGGVLRVTIIVKATFALGADGDADLVAPEPVEREDRFHDDDPSRSLRAASDIAPYLPGAGVVLTGRAHAPGAVPVTALSARLALFRDGPLLDKTIHVFGDPAPGSGAPAPFQTIPLVYERAPGGSSLPWNPVGVSEAADGTRADALDPAARSGRARPNLVNPANPHRPACFGPIAPHWPLRKRLFNGLEPGAAGPSVQHGSPGADPALAERAKVLHLPDDFDFRAFSPAPFDQQIPFLQGDEWILMEHLSAGRARVQTRLPAARARVRRYRVDAARVSGPQEISLMADALVIDGDRQTASLVWRGNFAIENQEVLQRIRLLAGVETRTATVSWPEHGASPLGEPAVTHRSSTPAAPVPSSRAAPAALAMTGALSKVRAPVLPFRDVPAAPQAPFSLLVNGGSTLPLGQRVPIPEDRLAELGAERARFPVAAPGTSGMRGEAPIPGAPWSPVPAPPLVLPGDPRSSQGAPTLVGSRPPERGVAEPAPQPEPGPAAAPWPEASGSMLVLREPSKQAAAIPVVETAKPEAIGVQIEAALPTPAEVAPPERGAPPVDVAPPAPAGLAPPVDVTPPAAIEPPSAMAPMASIPPLAGQDARKRAEAKLAQGQALDGDDLSGGDLSGLDFSGRSLARCSLRGAKLRGARLAGATLVEAVLDEADLRGADLSRAVLTNARADRAELVEAVLEEADLRGASLSRANLGRARLARARGDGATLAAANLEGADMEGSRFVGASFADANLREAKADSGDFTSARLDRADLGAASFRKARLVSAVLAHARLDLTDLRGADLARANLHGAARRRAKIAGANMKDIDETAPVAPDDPERS
ncbi:DUF2169 domain-containing protein [Sorangium sp. So ce124]|uniref:DUF2169 family type VI secretion system accessory protein n=1 Tax=Sorangium sp. So ce124 TaxID=3133280 RepID=UPI003F5FA173